jgi:hypothetical protein
VVESVRIRSGTVPLCIIGLTDLVQSKRDAGRHKDLDDVEHLTAVHGPHPRVRRRGRVGP